MGRERREGRERHKESLWEWFAPHPFPASIPYRTSGRWWSSGNQWQPAPKSSTQVPAPICPILTKITLPNPAQNLQTACHQGTPHEWQ